MKIIGYFIIYCGLITFILSSFAANASTKSSTANINTNVNVEIDPWQSLWEKATKGKKESIYSQEDGRKIVPESDLRDPNRRIWIITTACLPWMTGTSINPLLRAAYLAQNRPTGKITLLVPWLTKSDQEHAFPPNVRFNNPEDQKQFVYKWLREEAHLDLAASKLDIRFYSGRYHDEYHSIFPMGDLTDLIPDDEADVCVLEEPEHLNWYRAPFTSKAWLDKFKHVVGIIHTNYLVYTRSISGGAFKEPLLYYINQGMCRAYCHKIIKLSGALQEFAVEKEVISNVHGVRNKYLEIGDRSSLKKFTKGAYFIGKLAWPKGLGELFNFMMYLRKKIGHCVEIDIYGQGPHMNEIKNFAKINDLPVTFHGAKDHSLLTEYKVFVNPSVSEVLCTTIVEALAMGKWVICPKHPSNQFFEQFPNCLTYTTNEQFAANLYWALNHDPEPLTKSLRYTLSWEAATERFLQASLMTKSEQLLAKSSMDKFWTWALEMFLGGKNSDLMRLLAGAKGAANQIEYVKKYGSALPAVDEEGFPALAENEEIVVEKTGDAKIVSHDAPKPPEKSIDNKNKNIDLTQENIHKIEDILTESVSSSESNNNIDNSNEISNDYESIKSLETNEEIVNSQNDFSTDTDNNSMNDLNE